jgi:hypothetical protein
MAVKKNIAASKKEVKETHTNWVKLKQEYITKRLMGALVSDSRLTLKDFAEQHNLTYTVLRNHASAENWEEDVRKLEAAQTKAQLDSIALALRKGIEKIADDFATRELEVRKRHSYFAQMMQDKGAQALACADVRKMTVTEATNLLKFGISEERLAMGMPDQISEHLITPGARRGETAEDHIREYKRLQKLKNKLLDFIEGEYSHVPG